jgi:hypothetical protein
MSSKQPSKPDRSSHLRLPRELPDQMAAEIDFLRNLSLDERSRMIASACRAAAKIARSRLENGLPPIVSVPWPASTWEFLRTNAPHARR